MFIVDVASHYKEDVQLLHALISSQTTYAVRLVGLGYEHGCFCPQPKAGL